MSFMLSAQLRRTMKKEISSLNFQLRPYCEHQIEAMIAQGVQRMRSSNCVDQIDKVSLAQQNMKKLVKYFCNVSQEMGTYPMLADTAFDSALASCPPLWPYR